MSGDLFNGILAAVIGCYAVAEALARIAL